MAGLFQYKPLPEEDYIRVLCLSPSCNLEDALVTSIHITSLHEPNPYAALSYSWGMDSDGDASACERMTIDGSDVPITRNLFQGLRRLRSSTHVLTVWVDAVCINQKDLVERGSQVSRMAMIYRKAAMTLVWLGEGTSSEEDRLMHVILERLQGCDRKEHLPDNSFRAIIHGSERGWCTGESATDHTSCTAIPGSMEIYDDRAGRLHDHFVDFMIRDGERVTELARVVNSTRAFFARRYWKRRWIIQEMLLSDNMMWQWGPYSMPAYNTRIDAFYLFGLEFSEIFSALSPDALQEQAVSMEACREVRVLSNNTNGLLMGVLNTKRYPFASGIVQALSQYAQNECSDPRDRIYALLSLDEQAGIYPDYTITPAEVFFRFARMLVQHGMLKFLLVQLRSLSPLDDELSRMLPSWVPDFRNPFLWQITHEAINASVGQDWNVLELDIWELGSIQHVQEEGDDEQRDLWAEIAGSLGEWMLHLTSREAYSTSGVILGDLIVATGSRLEGETTPSEHGMINIRTNQLVMTPSSITEMLILRPEDQTAHTYKIIGTFESNKLRPMVEGIFNRAARLSDSIRRNIKIV